LPGKIGAIISRLFQSRDELSFRNIRRELWPVLLVFPLSVIMGDLRYFDLHIVFAGFESYELMLFPLGLGWLFLCFVPKRFIIPLLRLTAVLSTALLPLQIFIAAENVRLLLFLLFQFFNGVCAACAFFLFCFVLNNVERLFGMALIQLYYGFYYTVWRAFPAVQAVGKTWGGAAVMALYIVVVFYCRTESRELNTKSGGKGSGVPFVIGLDVIYYMIMCTINYIEWEESSVSSMVFGLGALISIGVVIVIQLLKGRGAMFIWLLFLSLSLLGLGALLDDSPVTLISGSFAYGLGDGLGYIIIYYMCAGAINRSKSLAMFRLYCFMFFIEYFFISGIFSYCFNFFDAANKFFAFAVALVLGSICLLLMPLLQRKLFEADWSDGLYLRDMAEYSRSLAETDALNAQNNLNLTPREKEIFTMLLGGSAPKEIAYTLKISYDTVLFHQKNMYRKLGIQSIQELFAKYLFLVKQPNHALPVNVYQ